MLRRQGTGADTLRRIAPPMIGGPIASFLMELVVYPVIFYLAKRWQLRRAQRALHVHGGASM